MEHLFSEFDAANAGDWKKRLEKDLKGITFEGLTVEDRNGIAVHPFYTAEDLPYPPLPLTCKPGWHICAAIEVEDAVTANKEALEALNNGASGITFILKQAVDPAVLLQEIQLPYIYSCFVFDRPSIGAATDFSAYIRKTCDAPVPDTFMCFDIIGHYTRQGQWQNSADQDRQQYLSFVTDAAVPALCIDATLFHNAGASSAYELACCLAQVNEYLHILDENGLLQQQTKLHISLAADTGFFEQIAKLRALRSLLPLLFQPYDINPVLHLHAVTSDLYRASFDHYNNLLRDTISGMAAVSSGCNSLYTRPFDAKGNTAFSRRMSRNQQLVFREESYLDKVADVAAGSYYIENLTNSIADKAWASFQQIEKQGGLIAAFDLVKTNISAQATQLVQDYKDGKRVLTGINKFPSPTDPPQALPEISNPSAGLHSLDLAQKILHA